MKPTVLLIVICSFSTALLADDYDFIVKGYEANMAQLKDGKGTAHWESESHLSCGDWKEEKQIADIYFAFKGDKLRWDADMKLWVRDGKDVGMPTRRIAIDGKRTLEYILMNRGYGYIGIKELYKGGEESGLLFDVRYWAAPRGQSLGRIKSFFLGVIGLRPTVAKDTENVNCFVVTHKKGNQVAKLWIDAAKGFSVVKEEEYRDGSLVRRVHREVKQYFPGFWFLTKVTIHGFDKKTQKRVKRKVISLTKFEPNCGVEDSEFTFYGLGLKPGATIVDSTHDGLMFTLGGPKVIQEKLNEAADSIIMQGLFNRDMQHETAHQQPSQRSLESPSLMDKKPQSQRGHTRPWVFYGVAGIIAFLMIGLYVYLFRFRTGAAPISQTTKTFKK